jgi:hypothetical protein
MLLAVVAGRAEVHPSFRALSGCLEFTVRRHKFNKDFLLQAILTLLAVEDKENHGSNDTNAKTCALYVLQAVYASVPYADPGKAELNALAPAWRSERGDKPLTACLLAQISQLRDERKAKTQSPARAEVARQYTRALQNAFVTIVCRTQKQDKFYKLVSCLL